MNPPEVKSLDRPSRRKKVSNKVNWTNIPYYLLAYIFSYLSLDDLKKCALVCRSWNLFLSDENNFVWRFHCLRKLSEDALNSGILSKTLSFKAKLKAYAYAWNPEDCSRHIFIKRDGFTLHRNPVARSTDGSRGKVGFNSGRHCWEVWWQSPLGTVAVIGIASKKAALHCSGYVALLGRDDHSWGWNIVDNFLIHRGCKQGSYPTQSGPHEYRVEERIRLILDCDDNTLAFEKNFEFLGVAFRNLPNIPLYPAVSAVYGNTEICMVYLGPPLDG